LDLESAEVARRQFDVTRKGYDRAQVAEYLQRVGRALAQWEAAARSAQSRVAQLERELREVHTTSEVGFHQLIARTAMAEGGPGPAPRPLPPSEADRVLTTANDQAVLVRQRAEAALEDALATTAKIEGDQERLLKEAEADRVRLLAEAGAQAERIVAEARRVAAKTREDAQRFAEELRELTAAETIELVGYAKEMAATILEAAGGTSASIEDEDFTIDLREPAAPPGQEPQSERPPVEELEGERLSRYEKRSAHLPRIGNDPAGSAVDPAESARDQEDS
jgi:DivIVA domain-containing protein